MFSGEMSLTQTKGNMLSEHSVVTCVLLEPHMGTFQKSLGDRVAKTKSYTSITMATEPEGNQEQAALQKEPSTPTPSRSRRWEEEEKKKEEEDKGRGEGRRKRKRRRLWYLHC